MKESKGFILVSTLLMLAVLLTLVAAYFVTTNVELSVTRHSKDGVNGFYAAEAGLNIRAEEIRQTFLGYNRPSGVSPNSSNENQTCVEGNMGSGHFSCQSYDIGNQQAVSYVTEDPTNPIILTIPPGERYQNLNAQEYRYTVNSVARNVQDDVGAALELRFKSRLVPLFQFAAFYDKDLEILPGATMTLEGPVHTNGDLYLNTEATFAIKGQVTVAGDLYRGRKNTNVCNSKPVTIPKAGVATSLIPSCSTRVKVRSQDVTAWNGMIQLGVERVTVPGPEVFDPTPGATYWDKADMRIVLRVDASDNPILSNSLTGVEVRNADNTVNSTDTAKLESCSGSISSRPVGTTKTFYNNREGKDIRMLEVDLRALFDCIHSKSLFGPSKGLDDSSEGGIVLHLSVDGPYANAAANAYGVRLQNANPLRATVSGAPLVKGLSVVSNQAAYVLKHFNKDYKIPAAIMADSFNVLSTNWNDDAKSRLTLANRPAPTATTINSAVLAGTDVTGSIEGEGGQGGSYNGGLENYPRLHEKWTGSITLTYYGSFVSLNKPRHVSGAWVYGAPQYEAPNRDWHYDTMFNDAAKLPPITPRQELFVRDYER